MKKFIVSPAPHIHSDQSTQSLMIDVIIALVPTLAVSIYAFGFSAIRLVLIGVATCVLTEYLIEKFIMHSEITIKDCSAIVTGLLLALNMPPSSPWWLILIGSFMAIAVGKMTYGGIGQNIFNPAIFGRVFLLVSFPVFMTDWSIPQAWLNAGKIDAVTGPTPLSMVREGLAAGQTVPQIFAANNFNQLDKLFINIGGSVGEISAIALVLGFIYLLIRRVIKPTIPLTILMTVFVFTGIFWLIDPLHYTSPIFNIFTGGVLIGAIFMATDYVTSPMTFWGQVIYGVGIGVITVLIRLFGSYPEGVSFAILIMNGIVPLLNKYIKPARYAKGA
jgi:electron transport complex protein RnfD